jgi:hypothetical protein
MNTFFKLKDIHKFTWESRGYKSITGYFITNAIVCDTAITTSVPCSLWHYASHLGFGGPEPRFLP